MCLREKTDACIKQADIIAMSLAISRLHIQTLSHVIIDILKLRLVGPKPELHIGTRRQHYLVHRGISCGHFLLRSDVLDSLLLESCEIITVFREQSGVVVVIQPSTMGLHSQVFNLGSRKPIGRVDSRFSSKRSLLFFV